MVVVLKNASVRWHNMTKKKREYKNRGFIKKFFVKRADGRQRQGEKHHNCDLFVLDVTHDIHAIPALRAYSKSARKDGYELLSNDLDIMIERNIKDD